MLRKVLFVFVLAFFSGCSQLDVRVDYDPEYIVKEPLNYAIVHHNKKGADTLTADRVIKALHIALDTKGYKAVTKESAELIFVFHTNVQDKSDIQTDYQMVGYGAFGYGRGFGGGMIATTNTYNYTEGTLVVDALNPKTQKIVWRGIAKDELKNIDVSPEKKSAYITKVVAKLMEKFPREEE